MCSGNRCGQKLKLRWTVAELLSRQAAQKGSQRGRSERPDDPSKLARYFFQGVAWLGPQLRTSNDHCFIVGFREHGDQSGHPAPFFSSLLKDFSILT